MGEIAADGEGDGYSELKRCQAEAVKKKWKKVTLFGETKHKYALLYR